MILFYMSKERKDTTYKKLVKLVIWLLVLTAAALIIWKLYGRVDLKRTNFSKAVAKLQVSCYTICMGCESASSGKERNIA